MGEDRARVDQHDSRCGARSVMNWATEESAVSAGEVWICKGGREPDQGTVLHYLLPFFLATLGWSRKHGRLTKASSCLQTCLKTLNGRGGLPEEHVERAIVKSLEMRTGPGFNARWEEYSQKDVWTRA